MESVPDLLETRFNGVKGEMFVVMDDETIVGCSGCYISDFSEHVGMLGVRSWLDTEYRAQQIIRELAWPAQRDWLIERGVKQVAVSFNDYNRNLAQFIKRDVVKREPKTPRHLFYKNKNVLPYRVMIQNNAQWVVYESLDPDWSFDWSSLKYQTTALVE